MRGDIKIAALLMMLFAKSTHGDTFYNMLNREDPCISLCEKTPTGFSNNMYVKSCCQRGCRFFNLVDLHSGLELSSLNGTRDACEASCTEAYTNLQDRYACSTGCDFMAKQRVSDLLSLFSIAMCMEEGIDSNVLLMSPDMPDDILTDPGLRKELFPGWWDSDGFKLPQTYVKTVPMDAGTVDYALSSDYSGETEQVGSNLDFSVHWALNYLAKKQVKVPYWGIMMPCWLFASCIGVSLMLTMMWLCALKNVGSIAQSHKHVLIDDTPILSKVEMYSPDEAPMYKEPPPKYD
ncbi:uncharacterized protein [Linepithema humile]|uniref:uncharacterized protein n=1 Tax=Linepithema humile TaxID=83485 RepID=UPI0006233813|nr:PREDICTED: uncharacterized protein LOC105678804 [Linepithema humile]